MANFVTPDIISIYETTIGKLRDDIGRQVTVINAPIEVDCPQCGWDPINKCSNNKYSPTSPYPTSLDPVGPFNFEAAGIRQCTLCRGKGKIKTAEQRTSVLCLISSLTVDEADKTPLGKNYKINYELTPSIDTLSLFKTSQKVIIDGTVCEIVSIVPVGIGNLSQLAIHAGGGV